MRITIINSTYADDPIVTRIGTLKFTLKDLGGLKMEANRTLATKTTIPDIINGTWVWTSVHVCLRQCLCLSVCVCVSVSVCSVSRGCLMVAA